MFSVFRVNGVPGLSALFLLLLSTGQAQRGTIVGNCQCTVKDLTQDDIVKIFQNIIKTYPCSSTFTEIKLLRKSICGKTSDRWVQQINSCIKGDATPCLKPTTTPIPVTSKTPSATKPSHIARTIIYTSASLATTEPLHMAGFVTSATSSTTVPPHITRITTNSTDSVASTVTESLADPVTEYGVGGLHDNQQNLPPSTALEKTKHLPIAVMSLLAVVFILVGLVAYLICRRRKAKQQSYEAVETRILENGVGSS